MIFLRAWRIAHLDVGIGLVEDSQLDTDGFGNMELLMEHTEFRGYFIEALLLMECLFVINVIIRFVLTLTICSLQLPEKIQQTWREKAAQILQQAIDTAQEQDRTQF